MWDGRGGKWSRGVGNNLFMAEADPLRAAWKRLRREHRLANAAPETDAQAEAVRAQLREAVRATTRACAAERARLKALATPPDLSDAALAQMARFCARLPLADFEGLLHLVPRLVNVVTVRSYSNPRSDRARTDGPPGRRAARRGHPRRGHGRQAAARPAEDRVLLQ